MSKKTIMKKINVNVLQGTVGVRFWKERKINPLTPRSD